MSRTVHRGIRQCPCQDCRESPKSATAEQHRTINRVVASLTKKGDACSLPTWQANLVEEPSNT